MAMYDRLMALPTAVVFDFDGVVVDSETPEFETHRRMFERRGLTLTPEEWVGQIGIYAEGYERRWFDRLLAGVSEPIDFEAFETEKRRLFDELVSRDPMRGIVDLLDELDRVQIPAAIASSSPARWVIPAAERVGIAWRFKTIVTGDVVANRKPAPDVYLEAVRRLEASPARSVAVEDSAPGVAAARAAGMKTIAIPHWLTERHDLSAADVRVAHAGDITLALLDTLFA